MRVTYTQEQLDIQPQLAAANINPESFLATDYLNHFNEIVMLMEMVPDMPELLEDAVDWSPKTYSEHFAESGFQAKDLAIKAYGLAPAVFKLPFESVCGEMQSTIQATVKGLVTVNVIERGLSPAAQALIRGRIEMLQTLLMQLNQLIHGKSKKRCKPRCQKPNKKMFSHRKILINCLIEQFKYLLFALHNLPFVIQFSHFIYCGFFSYKMWVMP